MKKPVTALLLVLAATALAEPIVLDFQYEAYKHRSMDFPTHCVSYMVFENAKKTRPLYLWGKQRRGTLSLKFDDEEALGLEPEVKGSAQVYFTHTTTVLGDWQTFACSSWLKAKRKPRVYVTLTNVRNVTAEAGVMKRFFVKIRERDVMVAYMATLKKGKQKPVPPVRGTKFKAIGDIEIKVSTKTTTVKNVPITLDLSGSEIWQINYEGTLRIKGADLGLEGDDAGELSVHVNGGAFCGIPPKFREEVTEKELKKLSDMMKLDEKLEDLP